MALNKNDGKLRRLKADPSRIAQPKFSAIVIFGTFDYANSLTYYTQDFRVWDGHVTSRPMPGSFPAPPPSQGKDPGNEVDLTWRQCHARSLVSLFWPEWPFQEWWRSGNKIFWLCPTLDSFNTSHLTIAWYLLTIKLCKPETGPRFGCSPPQQRKQNDRLSWNFVSRGARQCSEAWTMWYVLDFFVHLSRHLSKFLFVEIQIRYKLNRTFCIPRLKKLQQFSHVACNRLLKSPVCFSGTNVT